METANPAGKPVLMSWPATVVKLSCSHLSPVAPNHPSAKTPAHASMTVITQFYTPATARTDVLPVPTSPRSGAWATMSKEVTSHATCRTSHVVWSVISCCPVTLTTAKEYAIVESAKQKVTVSSLAFTPDLSVGTLVMHHATLAPPAHTPPALQRWQCSAIVGTGRRPYPVQRQPAPLRDMQLLLWRVSCRICS